MNCTDLICDVKTTAVDRKYTPEEYRRAILEFEEKFKKVPGVLVGHEMDEDLCPLKHTFVDGAYVREIFMPKGTLLTSKIHKITHPYFVMKGDVSVATEEGIVRIKAPFNGVTKAGTKRLLFTHADTIWITVHVTKEKDLNKIEEEIIAPTYEDIGLPVYDREEIEHLEEV